MGLDSRAYIPVMQRVSLPFEGGETGYSIGRFPPETIIKNATIVATGAGVATGSATITFSNSDTLTASTIVTNEPQEMAGMTYTDSGVTATITVTDISVPYFITMDLESIRREDKQFSFNLPSA